MIADTGRASPEYLAVRTKGFISMKLKFTTASLLAAAIFTVGLFGGNANG